MFKKNLFLSLLVLFVLLFWVFSFPESSYADKCTISTIQISPLQNKSLNSFQNYLYNYYLQEKKYIWVDLKKQSILGCSVNSSFIALSSIYNILKKIDEYIIIKDKKNFNLQILKLKSQIPIFLTKVNEYKRDKSNYEIVLKSQKNTITWLNPTIKIDTSIASDTITNNYTSIESTTTTNSSWTVIFTNKNQISKRFAYNGRDSFLQTDLTWKIEYYLVDTKDQIKLLASQKGIAINNIFWFYLTAENKYWIVDLSKHPIKDYQTFEILKSKFWGYIDTLTYTLNWITTTENLTSLSQLINTPITFRWNTWIIGNQITKAYSFENKEQLELYFQPYGDNDTLLKEFLIIRIWDKYYAVKIKILDVKNLSTLTNNIKWIESQKEMFIKLDNFKSENFDKLRFIIKDEKENEIEIQRDTVFTWVTSVFITYTNNNDYITQLQEYLKNYTTISFESDITLYYNRVDNMKQLLKDKFSELSTYKYIWDNIKNTSLAKWLFNTEVTGDEAIIFKTYKWISENIVHDKATKNNIIELSQKWELTGQISLVNNKSHFWIYTLKNRFWASDWISILFSDLLKVNGISSSIVTGRDNQSWIWHALVKIWNEYYDITNEIKKMKVLKQKSLLKDTEGFYKMPEIQLKTYFTEIKTKKDNDNFSISWNATIRNNIVMNLSTILSVNAWFVLYNLWAKDIALSTNTWLSDITDWTSEFTKDWSIYKSDYFENIINKPQGLSYIPFSGKKKLSMKLYFIYAYLQGYKYYYYNPIYNEIQFYKTR